MSEPFTAIATLVARPGQQHVLQRELSVLVAPSRAEAGCQYYQLHQDAEQPGTFYVLERWDNQAALTCTTAPHTSRPSWNIPAMPSNTSNSSACN